MEEKGFTVSKWRFLLPVILLFLSAMMVSEVKYPSFKSLDFRAKRSFLKMLIIVLCVGFFLILWEHVLPILAPAIFTAYLLYGFVRPYIPRATQREIEEETDEPESPH